MVWMFLLIALLVAACGPESSGSSQEELVAETQRIALNYQANGDLNQARSQLEALEVANPTQWLVYVAETALAENTNNEAMMALAQLATEMGLQSESIAHFAAKHNLLDSAKALTTNAALSKATPTTAALATPVAQTLTQTVAFELGTLTNTAAITSPAQAILSNPAQVASTTLGITPTTSAPLAQILPTQPTAKALDVLNVRSGPGTNYDLSSVFEAGGSANIIGKNDAGDWWQVALANGQQGWVYAALVETSGDTAAVAIAANIAPPPPTATAARVVEAPTAEPVVVAIETAAAAVEPTPAAEAAPTTAPAPETTGNDFVMVEKHLWGVVENGGQLNGPSVTCGQGRELIVNVLDANGSRLNGVPVQAIYGAQEVYVTGAQGKGDGVAEFVLGGGQAVKILRDSDGRDVTSDEVYNLSTKPWEIPNETLISGGYCTDETSCKLFVDNTGCYGHYSWTVTFKRRY